MSPRKSHACRPLDNSSTSGVVTSSGIYYGTAALGAPTGAAIGKVLNP